MATDTLEHETRTAREAREKAIERLDRIVQDLHNALIELRAGLADETQRECNAAFNKAIREIRGLSETLRMQNRYTMYWLLSKLPADARYVGGVSLEVFGVTPGLARDWCGRHREYCPPELKQTLPRRRSADIRLSGDEARRAIAECPASVRDAVGDRSVQSVLMRGEIPADEYDRTQIQVVVNDSIAVMIDYDQVPDWVRCKPWWY